MVDRDRAAGVLAPCSQRVARLPPAAAPSSALLFALEEATVYVEEVQEVLIEE